MAMSAAIEAPVTFETLLGRLEEITPVLERHRDEAEETAHLSDPAVEALKEAGFLRLYLPRSFGGLEVDPLTYFRIAERVSRVDSAAGWEMMVANGIAYVASYLPEEGFETMYGADPKTLGCGTFNTVGKAVPVEGGFLFSGRSGFNSGCHHAEWCLTMGEVEDGARAADTEPEVIVLYCPMKQAQVMDNWDVLGMRGTGSDDVLMKDLFVPQCMTFPMAALSEPCENRHCRGDLYRMPLSMLVHTVPIVALGALGAALDWVSDLAQNKTPFSSSSKLRERSIAQINYGKALGLYRASRALMETSMGSVFSKVQSGGTASKEDKADFFLSGAQAMDMISEGVKLAASVAGTSSIRKGNPLERAWRDIEVLRHHAYLTESRFGTVSQIYWGLEPDFFFISL